MERFEKFVVTIMMGIIMAVSGIVGSYTILYDIIDLYSDQATLGTLIITPVIIYWVVKSIIIRLRKK